MMHLAVTRAKYPTEQHVANYYDRLLTRVKSVPGVTDAGMINLLPLSEGRLSGPVFFADLFHHGGCERLRTGGGSDYKRTAVLNLLLQRPIDLRAGICLESLIPDVADHSNDLHPGSVGGHNAEPHSLTHRVATVRDRTRELFVDDADAWRVCFVVFGEVAPTE